jgi:plastocyanin
MKPMLLAAAALSVAAVPLSADAAPKTYTIVIAKMQFGPAPAGLRKGDRILWVNRDIFKHSATARDGSFDVDLPPGAHATIVVRQAGRIPFYCKYHPGMTGVLNVQDR